MHIVAPEVIMDCWWSRYRFLLPQSTSWQWSRQPHVLIRVLVPLWRRTANYSANYSGALCKSNPLLSYHHNIDYRKSIESIIQELEDSVALVSFAFHWIDANMWALQLSDRQECFFSVGPKTLVRHWPLHLNVQKHENA
jgi:hypothetical protein